MWLVVATCCHIVPSLVSVDCNHACLCMLWHTWAGTGGAWTCMWCVHLSHTCQLALSVTHTCMHACCLSLCACACACLPLPACWGHGILLWPRSLCVPCSLTTTTIMLDRSMAIEWTCHGYLNNWDTCLPPGKMIVLMRDTGRERGALRSL